MIHGARTMLQIIACVRVSVSVCECLCVCVYSLFTVAMQANAGIIWQLIRIIRSGLKGDAHLKLWLTRGNNESDKSIQWTWMEPCFLCFWSLPSYPMATEEEYVHRQTQTQT